MDKLIVRKLAVSEVYAIKELQKNGTDWLKYYPKYEEWASKAIAELNEFKRVAFGAFLFNETSVANIDKLLATVVTQKSIHARTVRLKNLLVDSHRVQENRLHSDLVKKELLSKVCIYMQKYGVSRIETEYPAQATHEINLFIEEGFSVVGSREKAEKGRLFYTLLKELPAMYYGDPIHPVPITRWISKKIFGYDPDKSIKLIIEPSRNKFTQIWTTKIRKDTEESIYKVRALSGRTYSILNLDRVIDNRTQNAIKLEFKKARQEEIKICISSFENKWIRDQCVEHGIRYITGENFTSTSQEKSFGAKAIAGLHISLEDARFEFAIWRNNSSIVYPVTSAIGTLIPFLKARNHRKVFYAAFHLPSVSSSYKTWAVCRIKETRLETPSDVLKHYDDISVGINKTRWPFSDRAQLKAYLQPLEINNYNERGEVLLLDLDIPKFYVGNFNYNNVPTTQYISGQDLNMIRNRPLTRNNKEFDENAPVNELRKIASLTTKEFNIENEIESVALKLDSDLIESTRISLERTINYLNDIDEVNESKTVILDKKLKAYKELLQKISTIKILANEENNSNFVKLTDKLKKAIMTVEKQKQLVKENDDAGSKDICIIAPMIEEGKYILDLFKGRYKAIQIEETGGYAYEVDLNTEFGELVRCLIIDVGEMGEALMATTTERVIQKWNPSTIVVVGIAGALDKDLCIGDVVIANQVVSYAQNSKITIDEEKRTEFKFIPSIEAYRPTKTLLNYAKRIHTAHGKEYTKWKQKVRLRSSRSSDKTIIDVCKNERLISKSPQVVVGHLASGPYVSASTQFKEFLLKNDRNYIAVEMESGGMLAAHSERSSFTQTMVIRGISDYADERKKHIDEIDKGSVRKWAVQNAMRYLIMLINIDKDKFC